MAQKFLLYFISFLIFIFAVSYSESVVSANIRVSATVAQPIGMTSHLMPEIINNEVNEKYIRPGNQSTTQLLLRIPHNQSAICIIETIAGKQHYYPLSEDLLSMASLCDQLYITSEIDQITIIYTEN
ncbi:MAG: hypothetical protein GY865_19560 [candidate division Zixibacteria bacterium]|nr:hypothetical protein [candidate division Zixibacteria bacterium]